MNSASRLGSACFSEALCQFGSDERVLDSLACLSLVAPGQFVRNSRNWPFWLPFAPWHTLCSVPLAVIVRALFLVVASFLALVLPGGEARAQTTATVKLGTAPIERRAERAQTLDLKSINYEDCVADDTLKVTLTVVATTPSLEIWVGETTDCSLISARTAAGADPDHCWKVYSQALAETTTITLKVRDILKHGAGEGTAAVCDKVASTSTGAGGLTMYFVLVNGNMDGGSGDKLVLKYDLQGPAPPTIDSNVLPGDTRLFPTWKSNSAASADTKNYYIYCEEAETASPCAAPTLMEGEVPPADSPFKRGETGQNATSGEAEGLTNGITYACAVAGYDKDDNIGKLSALACGMPEIVNGYFKQYRAAGGSAGGGYCSFGHAAGAPAGAAASLAALALLSLRRRSRRKA